MSSPTDSFLDTELSTSLTAALDSPTISTDFRAVSSEDLQEAAQAIAKVFETNNIPYAFCGGWEMMQLGVEGRTTDDLDCIVEKGFGICTHAITTTAPNDFAIGGHLSDGVQRLKYTSPKTGLKVIVDLLKAGEFGPRNLRAPASRTVQLSDGLYYLSPTELVRAKVKAYAARSGEKDKRDIVWLLTECGDVLDADRIDPGGELSSAEDVEVRGAYRAWVDKWGGGWEEEEEEDFDIAEDDDAKPPAVVVNAEPAVELPRAKGHVGFQTKPVVCL